MEFPKMRQRIIPMRAVLFIREISSLQVWCQQHGRQMSAKIMLHSPQVITLNSHWGKGERCTASEGFSCLSDYLHHLARIQNLKAVCMRNLKLLFTLDDIMNSLTYNIKLRSSLINYTNIYCNIFSLWPCLLWVNTEQMKSQNYIFLAAAGDKTQWSKLLNTWYNF